MLIYEGMKISNENDNIINNDLDRGLLLETKPKTKKPSMYNVLLLNDDYTPMEFVVFVLQNIFGIDRDKATQIMLAVHTQGKGVCGIFTKEVAETKSAQVNNLARENEHPLVSEIEPVDDE